MPFTIWTQDGAGVGPINSGADERRILTVKNLGANTIWLAPDNLNSNNGPYNPSTLVPYTNAAIAPGETLIFGVLSGESYYYGVVGSGLGPINVLVWEG